MKEEQHLQQAYGALIESISDTIIITDLEGVVVYWNKGAEEVFGYSREEMVGTPIRRIYAPEELDKVAALRKEVLGGERVASVELTEMRKQDGRRLTILLSVVSLRSAQGEIQWLAGIGKDITHIRELERKLMEAKKLEGVHDLVVTLNHEMNQPLAVLTMTLEMMVRAVQKAKSIAPEDYGMALKQVARMADLLQKIREIKGVVTTEYIRGEMMVDIERSIEGQAGGSQ